MSWGRDGGDAELHRSCRETERISGGKLKIREKMGKKYFDSSPTRFSGSLIILSIDRTQQEANGAGFWQGSMWAYYEVEWKGKGWMMALGGKKR